MERIKAIVTKLRARKVPRESIVWACMLGFMAAIGASVILTPVLKSCASAAVGVMA